MGNTDSHAPTCCFVSKMGPIKGASFVGVTRMKEVVISAKCSAKYGWKGVQSSGEPSPPRLYVCGGGGSEVTRASVSPLGPHRLHSDPAPAIALFPTSPNRPVELSCQSYIWGDISVTAILYTPTPQLHQMLYRPRWESYQDPLPITSDTGLVPTCPSSPCEGHKPRAHVTSPQIGKLGEGGLASSC